MSDRFNEHISTQARQYDTPFFIIWNEGDIRKITEFLDGVSPLTRPMAFNLVQWDTDKHSNPLCRVSYGIAPQGITRFPDRVCTIVCRKHQMRSLVDAELQKRISR